MKSPQEVLLKQISISSIGFEYVFEPDEYSKGNATREPADLVWACNNCVILMYMAQRKHKKRKPEAHAKIREEMIKHNLSQAKGWLGEWRDNGRHLTGRNAYQSFDLAYGDYKNTIVLSLLDCGDEEANFHADFCTRTGVTLCATLPHSALVETARAGGGIIEVLKILGTVASLQKNNLLKGYNILELVEDFRLDALRRADPEKKWLYSDTDNMMSRIRNLLKNVKAPSLDLLTSTLDSDNKKWEIGAILNDLDLHSLYTILYILREAIHSAGAEHTYTWHLGSILQESYYVIVSATTVTANNFLELNRPSIDFLASAPDTAKGSLSITWDTYFDQPLFFTTVLNPVPSLTEEFIERVLSLMNEEI
ncbi:hypothetical protein [Hymenobacter swuensis]|uniref:Uncharacterized protein n=1 Tax=Hymenobacter swuensis DY53 TaxID=1227739 RepID=W8F4K0_9BACT|nr:hypothetical protein [Hymenobacter swuensis]AHJ98917.1 hypothetical protein Hsw_3322 [Hymenobacter swuensis DY53]